MSESAVPARASAAPAGGGRAVRRRGRRRRRRRRRRRAARGAVQPAGSATTCPAREGAASSAAPPRKAAFWYWVPNNAAMRAAGIEDREEDFLRYMARLSRPERYDPDSPTFGMTRVGVRAVPGDLRERLARDRAAAREGRAAIPPLRRRARLLGRAARGQGADGPRAACPKGARETMSRRRRGRHPHACRRRPSATASTSAPATACSASSKTRRRGHRRRGRRRPKGAKRRVRARKAVVFAHRRLHPRPRAAQELPQRAGLRRLRGDHATRATSSASPAPSARSCAT